MKQSEHLTPPGWERFKKNINELLYMKYLGIDYGKRKVGLAVSEGKLAEPHLVIRYKSEEELLGKVEQVVSSFAKASKDKQVDQVIVGISEGETAEETERFGKRLEEVLKIPVVYQDETLTTQKAQELSIEAGMKRKKRKELEDAYSAALILQAHLDALNKY